MDAYSVRGDDKYYAEVKINEQPIQLEVNSGCGKTVCSERDLHKSGIKYQLQPLRVPFQNHDCRVFYTKDIAQVKVDYKNIEKNLQIFVIEEEYAPLLGWNWIRVLNIKLEEIDGETKSADNAVNQVDVIGGVEIKNEIL